MVFLQEWEADIYGIAMILVIVFAPKGLGGALRAWRGRRTAVGSV